MQDKDNSTTTEKQQERERPKFLFYRSFKEAIDQLPQDERLEIYEAIARYALDKEDTEFKRGTGASLVWTCIAPVLKSDYAHWSSGQRGGCPRGVKKPSMIGNRNAAKGNDTEEQNQGADPKQNQNKTKTKPKQNHPLSIDNRQETIDNRQKTIDKSESASAHTLSPRYEKFSAWMKQTCPSVMGMRSGISEEEFYKLLKLLPNPKDTKPLQEVLTSMENKFCEIKRYKSAYFTARNWLNRALQPRIR